MVLAIHRDDIVEIQKIRFLNLASTLRRQVIAAGLGCRLSAAIGLVTYMPSTSAGGIDTDYIAQPLTIDQRSEHAWAVGEQQMFPNRRKEL